MSDHVFKIEKGIAIPTTGNAGRRTKYPFAQMKVGESFSYPTELKTKIALAASQFGKRHKRKYSTQCLNGTGRCWRVK